MIKHLISNFMQAEFSSLLLFFLFWQKAVADAFHTDRWEHEENFALTCLCKDVLSEIFCCFKTAAVFCINQFTFLKWLVPSSIQFALLQVTLSQSIYCLVIIWSSIVKDTTQYLGFSESYAGWKWIVRFGNGYLCWSWVWKSSTGGSFLAVRFGQFWMVDVGLFFLNKNYPLKEAFKPNSHWILGDTFPCLPKKYPREITNINTACVLPWASSVSPCLWYNYIGTDFVSHYFSGCWSWTGAANCWGITVKNSSL